MPWNFHTLGLVALLWPNASVIHCVRDAMDTCFSCYRTYFAHRAHAYTCDLAELGQYYRDYQLLAEHWRSVLPIDPGITSQCVQAKCVRPSLSATGSGGREMSRITDTERTAELISVNPGEYSATGTQRGSTTRCSNTRLESRRSLSAAPGPAAANPATTSVASAAADAP